MSYEECTDDLNRVCADLENCAGDTSIALSMISDDNFFFETKQSFAKEMVTGFIRLNGNTVGAVANRSELVDEDGNTAETFDGVLTAAGCEKAAKFVEFCDAFSIPVLTLTNVKGYKADKHQRAQDCKGCRFYDLCVRKRNRSEGKRTGRRCLRQCIRCHEQQIDRRRSGICMACRLPSA